MHVLPQRVGIGFEPAGERWPACHPGLRCAIEVRSFGHGRVRFQESAAGAQAPQVCVPHPSIDSAVDGMVLNSIDGASDSNWRVSRIQFVTNVI